MLQTFPTANRFKTNAWSRTKYMPVSLATDGNAPLAGAAAWSESSDQHPCPPLQEAQLLGAALSGHGRERPRRLDALRRRLYCTACAKEGRPIAASHHPGESPKSALELEMRQILRSSEAVLEGGARAWTCTCTCTCMCMLHVHVHVWYIGTLLGHSS